MYTLTRFLQVRPTYTVTCLDGLADYSSHVVLDEGSYVLLMHRENFGCLFIRVKQKSEFRVKTTH